MKINIQEAEAEINNKDKSSKVEVPNNLLRIKTIFNESPLKLIESRLFHGIRDYFISAPIKTNLPPK